MNNTGKKVGYLEGLLESVKSDDSVSDKLLRGIVDVLSDLSDRADVMDDLLADLNDYVESIDDDLTALEGAQRESDSSFDIFGEDDEDDDPDSAEDHLHILRPDVPAEPQPEPLAGALCPDCMRLFFVSLDDPADAMYICPHCGKKIHPVALSPENAPVVSPAD